MFQVKDFRSITLSVINYMRSVTDRITDFSVGSVARTMVEAPAAEIDELYQKMFIGLREAIPVAIYQAFDFEQRPAVNASGTVRVNITPQATDTVISANTAFRLPNNAGSYLSQSDTTIVAGGSFADIYVVSANTGAAGNIVALQTFTLSPTVSPVTSASNLAAFSNGLPAETEAQRKVRFTEFVGALNHGTVAAIMYGLKLASLTDANGNVTETVQYRSVIEPYLDDPGRPIALVECYIHNGTGGASSELLARAREVIHGYYDDSGTAVPGWKSAGVQVDIYAATTITVAVTGAVTVLPGYDSVSVKAAASTAVSDYLATLDVGESALKSEIIALVMGIDGVFNFVPSLPVSDTPATVMEKIMPGAINFTD